MPYVQNEIPKLTITDQVMVFITTMFLFIHVKQLIASGSAFMLNALLGIWISMSIFDMYARWRKRQIDAG
jgi:hypothetical protein